uniref:Uncharacterized protein n=1 Tax=Plectus sambesii TaxID=2011161 RepID=A0A914VK29_9BILA
MRDLEFAVSSVTESDVIHASKSDLPRIFRVTTSQIDTPVDAAHNHQGGSEPAISKQYSLLMADNPGEKAKWVIALNELHRLLRKSRLADKRAFGVKELFDISTLPIIKSALCAVVIDKQRVVLGTVDHGLVCVELERELLTPVGGEKENKRPVERVEYDPDEQLLIVIAGKEKVVRLIPTAALDGRDLRWIKIPETKGCHAIALGPGGLTNPASHYFCVAIKKTVLVYMIDRSDRRHRKVRELAMPGHPQTMEIFRGKLCVGYPSGFRVWDLSDNAQNALVNFEDSSLQFLNQSLHDAQLIIDVSGYEQREFLLVFSKLGIYVDAQGRRCRSQELMFPSSPISGFSYLSPYLCVYAECHIDVFNVHSAEWVQTVNLKKAKPLTKDGLLSMCFISELPYIVLLSDVLSDEDPIRVPSAGPLASSTSQLKPMQPKRRRKFSIRNFKDDEKTARAGDRRSQLPISTPSDFIHITHMGPGEGIEFQKLIDLKTSPQSTSSHPGIGPATKMKQLMGPMMRSSSSSSANVHSVQNASGTSASAAQLTAQLQGNLKDIQRTRPLSAHSKSSEGSSLGRDGKMALQNTSSSSSEQGHYLEPNQSSPQRHPAAPPGTNTPPNRRGGTPQGPKSQMV